MFRPHVMGEENHDLCCVFSKFCQIPSRPHLLLDYFRDLTILVLYMKWMNEVVDGDRHGNQ